MIRVGMTLTCGCCGEYFAVWEGYEDQDQDRGWGICQSCQVDAGERNEAEFDKLIECLANGLNEENREKFLSFSRDNQKAFTMDALDKGIIKYSFRH